MEALPAQERVDTESRYQILWWRGLPRLDWLPFALRVVSAKFGQFVKSVLSLGRGKPKEPSRRSWQQASIVTSSLSLGGSHDGESLLRLSLAETNRQWRRNHLYGSCSG